MFRENIPLSLDIYVSIWLDKCYIHVNPLFFEYFLGNDSVIGMVSRDLDYIIVYNMSVIKGIIFTVPCDKIFIGLYHHGIIGYIGMIIVIAIPNKGWSDWTKKHDNFGLMSMYLSKEV